jgi:predicted dinucleotide-binding enzyme
MADEIHTIGILGAGKLGIVLSQLALKADYKVNISGSGDPKKIALSIAVLAPGANAVVSDQAVLQSDIVILALPLGNYQDVPKAALSGKLVIDAMNYWWEIDGVRDDLTSPLLSSSEVVQAFLSSSRVVKALNHMGYHNLHDEAKPHGATHRKAIAIAGDNANDLDKVASLVDSLGFDPIVAGELADGIRLQPGSEVFGAHVDKEKLQRMLDRFPLSSLGKEIATARGTREQ